jgi:hypothetical protein
VTVGEPVVERNEKIELAYFGKRKERRERKKKRSQ